MTTLLSFILTIAVLVAVHEWGHYRMARACGVRVLRFSVGFGKVLWRRQTSPQATEWVVCALPLGGYVRMLDSREAAVEPQELHEAFDQRPLLQRSLIVAAGPVANLVLAVLLYAASAWVGMQEPLARLATPAAGSAAERSGLQAGDRVVAVCREAAERAALGVGCTELSTVSELHWQLTRAALDGERAVSLELAGDGPGGARRARLELPRAAEVDEQFIPRLGLRGPFSEPVIARVIEGGAAQQAGLQAGDRVVKIDGVAVRDAASLRERVRASGSKGEPAVQDWLVLREGREVLLEVQPRAQRASDGQTVGRIEAALGTAPEAVLVRRGPLEGLVQGWMQSWEMSWLTLRMMGRMLVGEASLKQLSGPLTIADAAGQSVQRGAAQYLSFLALVSISLFVLNLLPLPMLDGGHLMYHLFEAFTGRPPSELWLERLQRVGMVLLLMLMALALTNDITRLMGLN